MGRPSLLASWALSCELIFERDPKVIHVVKRLDAHEPMPSA